MLGDAIRERIFLSFTHQFLACIAYKWRKRFFIEILPSPNERNEQHSLMGQIFIYITVYQKNKRNCGTPHTCIRLLLMMNDNVKMKLFVRT